MEYLTVWVNTEGYMINIIKILFFLNYFKNSAFNFSSLRCLCFILVNSKTMILNHNKILNDKVLYRFYNVISFTGWILKLSLQLNPGGNAFNF